LIGLHPENRRHLEKIQESIFAIVLDEASPASESEVSLTEDITPATQTKD